MGYRAGIAYICPGVNELRHSRFTLEFPGSLWKGYTAYTDRRNVSDVSELLSADSWATGLNKSEVCNCLEPGLSRIQKTRHFYLKFVRC